MKSKKAIFFIFVASLALVLVAGGYWLRTRVAPTPATAAEQPVTLINLAGPIADKSAEISGLAWHGEDLILLPQYPERFGPGAGILFALPKTEIIAALDGKNSAPLTPQALELVAPGLKESIADFQGFEAIGFRGDQVFLTIEAGQGAEMHGYLVSGSLAGTTLTLDTANVVEIALPIKSENHSDEALLVTTDKILTFYELNGADLVPQPAVRAYTFDLQPLADLSFPALEYRLTDITLASDGQVWALNYFFPGDTDMLPKVDPLAQTYGEGATHAQSDQVERLVPLQYSDAGLTLTDSAPLQLSLVKDSRNWEGLVVLDQRGFLLATDKYPGTLLGFVPRP